MHGQGMGGMGWWLSKRPGRESPLWRAPVHPLWRGTSPPPAAVIGGTAVPPSPRADDNRDSHRHHGPAEHGPWRTQLVPAARGGAGGGWRRPRARRPTTRPAAVRGRGAAAAADPRAQAPSPAHSRRRRPRWSLTERRSLVPAFGSRASSTAARPNVRASYSQFRGANSMAGVVSHWDAEDLRGDESWCGRGRPWCVCRARAPRGGGARDRARGGYPLSGYTWMRPGRPRRGERGGTRTGREEGDLSRSAVAASSPCFSACPQRCRVPLPVRWLGTPPPPAAASSTTVGLPQRPPSLLASKRQLPPPRAGSAWPGRTGPAHAVRGRGGGRATPARGTPRRGTIIMAAAAAATGAAATAKRPQPPS